MLSKRKLLFTFIVLRLVNAFLIQTYFVPDEIFQSVEVAHWSVFGSGYLSWEWTASLRSVLHPAFIALLYFICRTLCIDFNYFISEAPRLLHALLYAFSDYCYYRLAKRVLPANGAKFALLSYLSCWFTWYCAPRTLSNTLETILTLFALQWYPVFKKELDQTCWQYMFVGLVTIVIRPTAIIIWISFGLWHLWRCESPLKLLIFTCLPSCLPVLLFTYILDSVAYGKWTFTIWNFVRFNVLEGGSGHFGSHSWYWFLSQGLPVLLTIQLVPIILGAFIALRKRSSSLIFLCTSGLYIGVHSFITHKEHRFLLPIIPLLCLFTGFFFDMDLMHKVKRCRTFWIITILVVNIPIALYTGLIHQAGPFSTTFWIVRDAKLRLLKHEHEHFEIVQLMPCFSLPQYSYFHDLNVTIRALDCSPNLHHVHDYIDEADQFHSDPKFWINEHLEVIMRAKYLVFYEKIYELVQDIINGLNFRICARFFHAHFLSSSRQDHYIVVACR